MTTAVDFLVVEDPEYNEVMKNHIEEEIGQNESCTELLQQVKEEVVSNMEMIETVWKVDETLPLQDVIKTEDLSVLMKKRKALFEDQTTINHPNIQKLHTENLN